MFIIELTYIKDLHEVDRCLEAHIQYLDMYYAMGNFICSGRKNPRNGGVILCNAADLAEVNQIIQADPFYKEKIASYKITEFQPTKYADDFAKLVN